MANMNTIGSTTTKYDINKARDVIEKLDKTKENLKIKSESSGEKFRESVNTMNKAVREKAEAELKKRQKRASQGSLFGNLLGALLGAFLPGMTPMLAAATTTGLGALGKHVGIEQGKHGNQLTGFEGTFGEGLAGDLNKSIDDMFKLDFISDIVKPFAMDVGMSSALTGVGKGISKLVDGWFSDAFGAGGGAETFGHTFLPEMGDWARGLYGGYKIGVDPWLKSGMQPFTDPTGSMDVSDYLTGGDIYSMFGNTPNSFGIPEVDLPEYGQYWQDLLYGDENWLQG